MTNLQRERLLVLARAIEGAVTASCALDELEGSGDLPGHELTEDAIDALFGAARAITGNDAFGYAEVQEVLAASRLSAVG